MSDLHVTQWSDSRFRLASEMWMSPAELALHRTGGECACGCQFGGVQATFVFPPDRWPDNCVALSTVHRGGRIPRRAARHAELLATSPEMREFLRGHYGA